MLSLMAAFFRLPTDFEMKGGGGGGVAPARLHVVAPAIAFASAALSRCSSHAAGLSKALAA